MTRMADQKIVDFAGYEWRLHTADVAVITPSRTNWDYMLVEGALQRMARALSPVVMEAYPETLEDAHRTLSHALQRHPVWILLRDVKYPAWVMATLIQVQGAQGGYRVFVARGQPYFELTEFTF